MPQTPLQRFFGGSPGWVLVRLAFLSVIVGLVFSALGIHFDNLFEIVRATLERIWDLGYEIFERSLTYFLLGAAVVFPIWLVMRIIRYSRQPDSATGVAGENRNSKHSGSSS